MTDETQVAAQAPADDTTLAPEVIEGELPADDAGAAAEPEAQAEQPKPKKTAQERINELTAKTRQAERDAEYWRTEAQRHQQAQPAPKPAEPQGDGAPNPDDYTYGESDAAYIRDHATHVATNAVTAALARQSQQNERQAQYAGFEQRVTALFPDGEPDGLSAIRRRNDIPEAVFMTVINSEIGPKLADHLGSHPAELQRLIALPAHTQAYEIGKLEARLSTAPAPAKTITSAPEPTPTIRGTGGQFKVAADTNDFSAFEKAYP